MPRATTAGLALAALASSVSGFTPEAVAAERHSLRAAAGSSPRPVECSTNSRAARHDTLWDRAKNPRLSRYCVFLARGYAKLVSEPSVSVALSEQASKVLPKRAAPWVLKARALRAQGNAPAAFAAFETAKSLDQGLRLSPSALHDYALAAADSQHEKDALSAYRRLVPMAGLLTRPGQKEQVYVEAAILVMMLDPGSVQEAAAYLLEARRGNLVPSLRPFILASLALALDRQGRREEARGVASEVHGLEALASRVPEDDDVTRAPTGPLGLRIFGHELLAMIAVVAASQDRSLGRERWQEYVDRVGNDGAWVEHAKSHLVRAGGR